MLEGAKYFGKGGKNRAVMVGLIKKVIFLQKFEGG